MDAPGRKKYLRLSIWILFCVVLVAGAVSLIARAMTKGPVETLLPDPHMHVVDVHAIPWSVELADQVVITEVKASLAVKSARHNVAENQSKTTVAFTVDGGGSSDPQCEHVYLHDVRSGQLFVIMGVPLGHRPFSDLCWVQDHYLVFDRWSQPHYGMHYVVDTRTRKLVLAAPFPDQFYVDSVSAAKAKSNAPRAGRLIAAGEGSH